MRTVRGQSASPDVTDSVYREVKGVCFGGLGISSLLFADDVVCYGLIRYVLSLTLGLFEAECEATWMRIHSDTPWLSRCSWKRFHSGLGMSFCHKGKNLSILWYCS